MSVCRLDSPRADGARAGRHASKDNSLAQPLLILETMAHVLVTFRSRLGIEDGKRFIARACGGQREDGMWEGWIEFVAEDGRAVLNTARETTQPNLADLNYWATGLTPVYLEGALARARDPLLRRSPASAERPLWP
jgi:hypothetical protein